MLAALCATISIAILLGVVFVVAQRGAPVLSWSFFTEQIRLVGAAGGILWNLVGTMILLAAAFTLCTPFAVSIALVESVWLQRDHARHAIRLALYTLNGLPSIVFGLFGFIVLVQWCGLGKSWLAGGVALALSILPTVAVATLERLHAVPARYVEAASALGLNRSQLIWSVLLPQAWGGVITGSLLGLARAAGETAPIMFTATIFSGATWPHAIRESPVLTLPYHIFILAQDSFDPAVGAKLWGAALVLLALVFLLSLLALPARLKMHEEANV
jgi:phosphate transport system permease protein